MPSLADAWPALALLLGVLCVPWGVAWLKRQGLIKLKSAQQPLHVVSVLAVGPQQKVVTVEIDLGPEKKWLLLGVTPQSVTRLDAFDKPPSPTTPSAPTPAP